MYLPQPVFSHGQLYVAMSRATARSNIKILALPSNAEEDAEKDERDAKMSKKKKKTKKEKKKKVPVLDGTYTKNIVYKEVLTA